MVEFIGFPKIPKYSRDCIVTEKLDGTSGCIYIGADGELLVGSRSRWITPDNDNHGFARWAYENKEELLKLGPGRHFGEFWGQGIQRGYGLKEKKFSLFNVIRWNADMFKKFRVESWRRNGCKEPEPIFVPPPACCGVVPVITYGPFGDSLINLALSCLEVCGSYAAPRYMNPEGIVIFHCAGNILFKKTIHKDEEPKGRT